MLHPSRCDLKPTQTARTDTFRNTLCPAAGDSRVRREPARSATIGQAWSLADGPREAARSSLRAGLRRPAPRAQVDERAAEERAPRKIPERLEARRRMGCLDRAGPDPGDPDGGVRRG